MSSEGLGVKHARDLFGVVLFWHFPVRVLGARDPLRARDTGSGFA
jgi:hypothetical protein